MIVFKAAWPLDDALRAAEAERDAALVLIARLRIICADQRAKRITEFAALGPVEQELQDALRELHRAIGGEK